jgi:hypothetical protein
MQIIENSNGTKFASIDYGKTSEIAKRENRDCVVRAVAASMEVDYDEAHKWVATRFNRQYKKGTFNTYRTFRKYAAGRFNVIVEEMGEVNAEFPVRGLKSVDKKMFFRYNRGGKVCFGALTMARFLKKYNKGTYFVLVSGHALAVRDGIVYGNHEDSLKMRVRIESAFKITKKN